jgi:hypothetical protein
LAEKKRIYFKQKKTKKMNQTEEILTISGKEFKIILFSKEKVDPIVPTFSDEEIREMVLDEWERKINIYKSKI